MLLINAVIPAADRWTKPVCIRLRNGLVERVARAIVPEEGEKVFDMGGDHVLPGFVDVHIHAFRGHDTMEGEDAVRAMSRDLYQEGVAAFLPTTMSADVEETRRAVSGIRAAMNAPEPRSARILGAHMEAPFLNAAKAGAQRAECFLTPDWDAFLSMTDGYAGTVGMLTLAPELDGSEVFIRQAAAAGVVISIGHTAATAEQVHAAADSGATHVTHTFNAQTPLNHRAPGVPGAALVDERLYTEFIADGVHLHGDIVRLIARSKGADKAVAITDAMEAAGMPDGQYSLGGQPVVVKDGQARLLDGTLAGSVLTMRQALHNLIHLFGIAPLDAVRMCTATPADSVGEPLAGRLQPGSPAPLTRWSKDWQYMGILDEYTEA